MNALAIAIFGNRFSKPFTLEVPGAAKMHYGDTWFCVETTKAELRCAVRQPDATARQGRLGEARSENRSIVEHGSRE